MRWLVREQEAKRWKGRRSHVRVGDALCVMNGWVVNE